MTGDPRDSAARAIKARAWHSYWAHKLPRQWTVLRYTLALYLGIAIVLPIIGYFVLKVMGS